MLKDKNIEKAKAIVAESPTGKLTLDQQADLIANLKLAKDAYFEAAKATKEHYKEVYEPMCARKAELEIRMHELQFRIDEITEGNPAADAMVKLVMKALNKKKKA